MFTSASGTRLVPFAVGYYRKCGHKVTFLSSVRIVGAGNTTSSFQKTASAMKVNLQRRHTETQCQFCQLAEFQLSNRCSICIVRGIRTYCDCSASGLAHYIYKEKKKEQKKRS